jgi:hypothetical protein
VGRSARFFLSLVVKEFASKFREKFRAMQFLFSDFDSFYKTGAKMRAIKEL